MSQIDPVQALFRLEVEFHRLARTAGLSPLEQAEQHARYALQMGYDRYLEAMRNAVSVRDVDQLVNRLLGVGDPRDVLKARDSLAKPLEIRPFMTDGT